MADRTPTLRARQGPSTRRSRSQSHRPQPRELIRCRPVNAPQTRSWTVVASLVVPRWRHPCATRWPSPGKHSWRWQPSSKRTPFQTPSADGPFTVLDGDSPGGNATGAGRRKRARLRGESRDLGAGQNHPHVDIGGGRPEPACATARKQGLRASRSRWSGGLQKSPPLR